jgi:hypothetical protein
MTQEERQMMQPAQEYIRKLQQKRNAGLGYAKTRSHFRYDKVGDLVETRFPVWTEKGQEFIKNLITGNRHKEKARNLKTTKAI